jgi:hypothetical protein
VDGLKLLSEPTNYAVVQLPERCFPGVVFQGDSLNSLIVEIEAVAAEGDPREKATAMQEVIDHLRSIRSHYEHVLSQAGIQKPY